jgi:hypothetical protein
VGIYEGCEGCRDVGDVRSVGVLERGRRVRLRASVDGTTVWGSCGERVAGGLFIHEHGPCVMLKS